MSPTSLSIVTLSFNQGTFLPRALDSVHSQGYPCIEQIVVDPGSSDGSRELLRNANYDLSQVIFESDEGPADGLNRGFDRCSGSIFGYLNADDEYLPGALLSMVREFERRPHTDVLYGDGWMIDDQGTRLRKVWSDPYGLRQYARGTSVVLQQATFFRRRLWDAGIRFNPSNRTCWDGEFLMDAALAGARLEHVRCEWGLFRVHPESITGSGRLREETLQDHRRMARRILGRDLNIYDTQLEQGLRAWKRLRRAYWSATDMIRRANDDCG
jgi:glycosyltransferase involved in cell wall biosynthesis